MKRTKADTLLRTESSPSLLATDCFREDPPPGAAAGLAGLALPLPRADMFGPLRGGGWEPQNIEQGMSKGEVGGQPRLRQRVADRVAWLLRREGNALNQVESPVPIAVGDIEAFAGNRNVDTQIPGDAHPPTRNPISPKPIQMFNFRIALFPQICILMYRRRKARE